MEYISAMGILLESCGLFHSVPINLLLFDVIGLAHAASSTCSFDPDLVTYIFNELECRPCYVNFLHGKHPRPRARVRTLGA